MKKAFQTIAFSTYLLIGLIPEAFSAKDARGIMEESDIHSRPHELYSEYKIEVFDHEKLVSTKHLIRMDKKKGSICFTLLRFTEPISAKGSGVLMESVAASENNIWSYMPSTKLLRRISGAQKQNWFMGTDFAYEDFEDYKIDSHSFELIDDSKITEAKNEIVIDAYPSKELESKSSGYSKKRYFLNGDSLYPIVIEYYDKDKQISKKLVSDNLKTFDGITIAGQQTMYNYKQNSKTVIFTLKSQINKGISDDFFTPKFLRSQD